MEKYKSPIAKHQSQVDNARKLHDLVRPTAGIWIDAVHDGDDSAQGDTYETKCLLKILDNMRQADIFGFESKTSRSKAKNFRVRLFCTACENQSSLLAIWGTENSKGRVIFNRSFSNHNYAKTPLDQRTALVVTDTHVEVMRGETLVGRIPKSIYIMLFGSKIAHFANTPAERRVVKKGEKDQVQFKFGMPECLVGLRENVFWQYVEDGFLSLEFRIRDKDYGNSNNLKINHLRLMYDLTVLDDGTVIENPVPKTKAEIAEERRLKKAHHAAGVLARKDEREAKRRQKEADKLARQQERASKAAIKNNAKLALAA